MLSYNHVSFCSSPRSDVEAVAALLKRFLGLEELQRRQQDTARGEDEDDSAAHSSDSDSEAD